MLKICIYRCIAGGDIVMKCLPFCRWAMLRTGACCREDFWRGNFGGAAHRICGCGFSEARANRARREIFGVQEALGMQARTLYPLRSTVLRIRTSFAFTVPVRVPRAGQPICEPWIAGPESNAPPKKAADINRH